MNNGGTACGYYVDQSDIFIATLDPHAQVGSQTLTYSTYYGGSGCEEATGIAVGPAGQAGVVGATVSPNLPTTLGAYDPTYASNSWDGFALELDPAGNGNGDLTYATYLGVSGQDWAASVAADARGDWYVVGLAATSGFPTTEGALTNGLVGWVNWGVEATHYGTTSDREDFAEAVRIYFWPQWDEDREWTDDMGEGLATANDPAWGGRGRDGLRLSGSQLSPNGNVRVQDRFDFVEREFKGVWY